MLKRIFWAATITIPLYLSLAIESSSKPEIMGQQIIEQPQQVIGYFKKRFTEFQQGLEETPKPSVKLNFSEQ
jgi:hypothetical protein